MEKITVIFGSNKKPGSLAIRLFCWSRFSHCGLVIDNTHVIESLAFNGVVLTPIAEFTARYTKLARAEIPCENAKLAIELAHKELGKGYDYWAIPGILFRTGWGSKRKWFCSELLGYVSGLFRENRVNRITPEHIWMISR
jgi:uncharacterized protein YycO